MLMVCGDDLVALLPVQTIADDIHPLACTIRERNLTLFRMQEFCNTLACPHIYFRHPFKCFFPQPSILKLCLQTLLYRLYRDFGEWTESASIKIQLVLYGRKFLAN